MQSTMISAAPVSVYPPSNRKRTREYSDEEHDKKRSHRMVEQRRRERMNGLIDELSALIPLSFLTAQPNRTRPNILTAAISYLEAAQKVLSAVEGASSLSLTRRQINDSSSNAHFNIDSLISAHHGHGADSGSAVAMAQHHQDSVHAASEQSVAMAAAKASFHAHHGPVSSSPAAALAQHHQHHHHHHHHPHHPHHHEGGMGVSQMPLTLNGSSTGCVNLSNIEASGVTIMAQAAHHASQVQVGSERAARTRSTGTRRSTTPTTTSPRTTSARTSPTAAILHTNTSSIPHPSNAPSASAAIINRNSSSSSASHMSAVSEHSTPHHHSATSPHHHDQQSAMSAILEMLHSSSPHRSPVASSSSSSSSATTSPHHHHFYPHLPEPVSVVAIDHHDDMAATSLRELESLATATTAPLNSTTTTTTTTTTTSASGATTTTATSTVCGAAAAAAALASSFPEANESESTNLHAHSAVEPSHYLHHGVSIDELTMYS